MKRLLLFIIILSLICNLQINAQVPQAERDALIDLYNATNGSNWTNNTNWNTEAPVSTWHGITVENNVVTEIALDNKNLEGTIPSSIINLSAVEIIYFYGNKLEGNLIDFSSMPNLQVLYVSNNNYDFLDLEVNFSSNSMISTFNYSPQNPKDEVVSIDAIIGNDYNFSMTPVEGTNVLYQWHKGSVFSGGVPIPGANTTLLDLPSLQTEDLDTYVCFATSVTIPDLIIKRATIDLKGPVSQQERDALIAFYNATGGVSWLGNYGENWNTEAPVSTWNGVTTTGNRVTRLVRQSCGLTGQLPENLGDLIHLEGLYIGLGDLNLTGSIPERIGDLTQLTTLWFQGTGMTGELPESIGNLINLTEIRMLGNNFYGPLPESIGNLTQLKTLNLFGGDFVGSESNFSGVLPSSLGNLTDLEVLTLSENSFEGELPASLSNLNNAVSIDISKNNFFGPIPFNSPNATIAINNNNFNFSDIEPFVQIGNYSTLNYSPQNTDDGAETIESGVGVDITLNVNDTNLSRSENETSENNNYQWYKDGVVITGANSADYTIFNVQISDSGAYTCEITNDLLPNLIIIREAITLNIDPNLRVVEIKEEDVSIYPNPTTNWLNITTHTLHDAKLGVYDSNGRQVLSKTINGTINVLNVEDIQSGTYFLKIEQDTILISKRFIKN